MMTEADYRDAMTGDPSSASSFTSKTNIHNTENPFDTLKKKVIRTEHVSTRTLRPVFGHRKKVSRSTVRVKIEDFNKPTTADDPLTTSGTPFDFQKSSLSSFPPPSPITPIIEEDHHEEHKEAEGVEPFRPIFGVQRENILEKSPKLVSYQKAVPTSREASVVLEEEPESVATTTVTLPEYAWSLHEICRQGIARRRLILNVMYNAQIVLWTATIIIAAVLYGHYYEGYPQVEMILDDTSRLFGRTILVEDWWQLGAFCATVLLPLYITFLIASRDSFLKQPFSLPHAQATVETEIFLFRTKTGIYKDLDTCRQSLATKLEQLWNDSIRDEVAEGIVWTTKEEDEDDDGDEHEETDDNSEGIWTRVRASVTGLLWSTQGDSGGDKKGNLNNKAEATSKDGSPLNQRQLEQRSKPLEPLETDSLLIAELPSVSFELYSNDSSDPEAQKHSSPSKSNNGYSAIKTEQDRDIAKEKVAIVDPIDRKECKDELPDNDFIDDGYSDLSPEQYMNARIPKIRAEKETNVKFWQFFHDCFEQGIQILTLGASVTALFSMQWTIPIILAVSAALTSVLEIGDFRKSILSTNQVLKHLDELQEGYKTKAMGQKEVEVGNDANEGNDDDALLTLPNEQARESLVEAAETVILKGER